MNWKHSIALPLVAVLAAGALIAGCGDDDEDTDAAAETIPTETIADEAETLTKAEWIKQADAICQETDEQVGAVRSTEQPEGPGSGRERDPGARRRGARAAA